MFIDFATLTEYQRYKLMASLIVPRPIALVTTINPHGIVNAAPFSMFNMMGEEPPIVMISVNRLKDGTQKDTAGNILRTREFVVHLADEAIAEQMHHCGERLPPDQSELTRVGLTPVASRLVRPPRIAEAPVAFECTLWETLETASRQIFIGLGLETGCIVGVGVDTTGATGVTVSVLAGTPSTRKYFPFEAIISGIAVYGFE
jgi:flavin reductase (DIM6/NTAB) family NADH-FMN oxidoreductase RutF